MNQKVNRRRSNSITIRMTNDEKKEWLNFINQQNKSYTDILLSLIKSNSTINIDTSSLQKNTVAINKIGANLNQISKHLNQSDIIDSNTIIVFENLENILNDNKKYLVDIWRFLKQ